MAHWSAMRFRTLLMLAFALAGLLPAALFVRATGPEVERLREGLAREERARAERAVRERIAAWEREARGRLDAWCARSREAAARYLAAAAEEGWLARRRRRKAVQEVAAAAAAAGVTGGTAFDASGNRLLRLSAGGDAAETTAPEPGAPAWSFEPAAGVRLALATACPDRDGPVLRLVVERTFATDDFERELARAALFPVSAGAWLPGRRAGPAESERLLIALPAAAGRPPAAVEVDLRGAGEGPARRLAGRLWGAALATGALGALLGLAAGWVIGGPLARLTREVERRADGAPERTPLPGGPGEVGVLARAVDRLVARLDREQLRRARAERLAAWQEVARRVAHEVRNPLTPIRLAMDNLRRARRRAPAQLADQVEAEAEAVLAEVDRLERLVREFSEFARLPEPRPQPVEIGPLAERAVSGQVPEDAGVRLETEIGPDLPQVAADPDLLGMALANLARNAVQALAGRGGRVRLHVAARPRAPIDGADGRLVEIAVEDDGPGLPEALAGRLFEPYVTGRGPQGTGLGLAIVRWIVRGHGGLLRAGRGELGGARVAILLPADGRPLPLPDGAPNEESDGESPDRG